MLRKILTTIGLVEFCVPKVLIEAAEKIALDNPAECELRSWVIPGARVEGLALVFFMWRSDASYSAFKKFLGVIGSLALVSPRAYVDNAAPLAYTDASNCEWKPWVYHGTRLVGLLYVLIALNELRDDYPEYRSDTHSLCSNFLCLVFEPLESPHSSLVRIF